MLAAVRPEQEAAAHRARAAREAARAATLGWAPDVTGKVTGLVTENEGFAPNETFVVATLEASWLWDGGGRSARVAEAQAASRQAEAWRDAVDRRVEEQVRVAWAGLERAESAVVAATREREAADARLLEASSSARGRRWVGRRLRSQSGSSAGTLRSLRSN